MILWFLRSFVLKTEPQCYNWRCTILRGCVFTTFLIWCYACFLVITRCRYKLHQYELSLWGRYVKYWVHSSFFSSSPAPFLHQASEQLSFNSAEKLPHISVLKHCCPSTTLKQSFLNSHLLQFYGFGFKVFSTPQFSLLSKVYLPWLSQVLKKWSIFLFSRRAVVIADKQTVSRRNFIPTVSSSVSKNGLAIAPVLVHGSHLSIWKAFSYVVQHKAIPCSKCRKLKHLLK